MPCASKQCDVFLHGVSNLFKDKPFIPRIVRVVKHDVNKHRDFYVKPFITYNELSTYRQRRARLQSTCFTFDDTNFNSLQENEFKKKFCEFVKDYSVLVVDDEIHVKYIRSFAKDKKILQRKHHKCSCRE
jgi:hypothetical protein